MARPAPDPASLVNQQEGWDANLRDLLTAILSNPLPLARYTNEAALPDATQYEDCIAVTEDHKLWFSNGTTWLEATLT